MSNARYRLQRKERYAMPNTLGNASFPVHTYRWKDIYASEQATEWSSTHIYSIINARYEAYMPTIVATNYTGDELVQRMTPSYNGRLGDTRNAEKTLDRLREMCAGLEMYWDSYRTR